MAWTHEHDATKREASAPVTLPRLAFQKPTQGADPDSIERKELATKFAEARIIRTGRDAWSASNKANSLDAIRTIGKALLIGRNYAMRVNGVSIPKGRNFSVTLRRWMKDNGFGNMSNTTRKHIVILTESTGVTAWWSKLPELERNRMANAQHIYRRWQASLKNGHGKPLAYVKRDAITAWRRFTASVRLLPVDEAAPLWEMIYSEATAHVACLASSASSFAWSRNDCAASASATRSTAPQLSLISFTTSL
jgi:hypothetical protein